MGTSHSVAELTAKMFKAADTVPAVTTAGVTAVAQLLKTTVDAELVAAGVKNNRLRGVGRSGARVAPGYEVKPGPNASALVRMKGPAHLIEFDTKAHDIAPKRAAALSIPGVGARMSAHVAGTKGKHPWEKAVAKVVPLADRKVLDGALAALRKIF